MTITPLIIAPPNSPLREQEPASLLALQGRIHAIVNERFLPKRKTTSPLPKTPPKKFRGQRE